MFQYIDHHTRYCLLLFGFLLAACNSRPAAGQLSAAVAPDTVRSYRYAWKPSYIVENKLVNRIVVPSGFTRLPVAPGSFAGWLRDLPLKSGHPAVYLYSGARKFNQRAQFAVIDIDTGDKDLQQCADAVMRLRAEYFYAVGEVEAIHFNFTSGFYCDFEKWTKGYRPVVHGNSVTWSKKAAAGSDYPSFRKYLERIFMYCGTLSLSAEMKSKDISAIAPGDVFIRGGSPGHAVIVLDVAVKEDTGERVFLLAQSYMPAQDMHVLVNPDDASISPWYSNRAPGRVVTPEWTFERSELKEF